MNEEEGDLPSPILYLAMRCGHRLNVNKGVLERWGRNVRLYAEASKF